MKKIIAFFLTFVLILMVGCSSNDSTENNKSAVSNKKVPLPMSATVYNENNELQGYMSYSYNSDDKMEKMGFLNLQKEWEWYYLYVYDKDGNMIEQSQYNSEGEKLISFFSEYDKDGHKTKEVTDYVEELTMDTTKTFEYDGDLMVRMKSTHDNSYSDFEYDKDGKMLSDKYYHSDGSLSRTWKYEYDEKGNHIKLTFIEADGSVAEYTEYKYDDTGFCTTESRYSEDGKLLEKVCYSTEKII